MKIRWKKVFYFVMFLGSLVGFKNVVGQNDSIQKSQNQNIESKYSISGLILESDSVTPIPFCNVILLNDKKDSILCVQTDFDGRFLMNNINKGIYIIKTQFTDYMPFYGEYFLLDQNIELQLITFQLKIKGHVLKMCYSYIEPPVLIDSSNTRTFNSYDIDGIPPNYRSRKPNPKP
jgi:hypothetical protein